MESLIQKTIEASIEAKTQMLADENLIEALEKAVQASVAMYKRDGNFLAIGNGGSAADVQHIVSELVGRVYYDHAPLRAQALTSNSSNLTLIGNDYGYDQLFARQVWACGKKGDVLLAISTSGNSPNVILAVEKAREIGMYVIGMTGARGGKLSEMADVVLKAPSTDTARIQECHGLMGHILVERIEAEIFPRPGTHQ